MKPYTPIDCALYDQLELLAMRKQEVLIVPYPFETYSPLYLQDFNTVDKVEYAVFSNGLNLRLDRISAIDEQTLFLDFDLEEE